MSAEVISDVDQTPDWLQIPYLKTAELVVVSGAGALAAVERLYVDPVTGDVHLTRFNDCLLVDPAKYARIMRKITTDTGRPSIIAPLNKGRAKAMIASPICMSWRLMRRAEYA